MFFKIYKKEIKAIIHAPNNFVKANGYTFSFKNNSICFYAPLFENERQ